MTKEEDKLKKFLASDDPELVRMGIAMAKGLKVEVTVGDLEHFLKSDDVETVRNGVLLADEAGIDAVEPLINLLKKSDNRNLVIATALGDLGDARTVEIFLKMITDGAEEGNVAADALVKIGDKSSVGDLIELLSHAHFEDYWTVRSIARALGGLGDVQALTPLIYALQEECTREIEWNYDSRFSDENSFIQNTIVDAILQLGVKDKITIATLLEHFDANLYGNSHLEWLTNYIEYADENSDFGIDSIFQHYVLNILTYLGWKPETDEERLVYCAAMYPSSDDALLEWGIEAIDPLVNILESGKTFASKALSILTEGLVKTDEKEKILKFLESDDPAMIQMGVSLLKATVRKK